MATIKICVATKDMSSIIQKTSLQEGWGSDHALSAEPCYAPTTVARRAARGTCYIYVPACSIAARSAKGAASRSQLISPGSNAVRNPGNRWYLKRMPISRARATYIQINRPTSSCLMRMALQCYFVTVDHRGTNHSSRTKSDTKHHDRTAEAISSSGWTRLFRAWASP